MLTTVLWALVTYNGGHFQVTASLTKAQCYSQAAGGLCYPYSPHNPGAAFFFLTNGSVGVIRVRTNELECMNIGAHCGTNQPWQCEPLGPLTDPCGVS